MSSENYLIINLSVTDLLEIYHQAPKVLLRCATKVSVKEESLQKLNQEPVFLVKVRNGNYWVIATEDANFYWLLPKSNLRVNSFEYQSVQYLFECQGYQPDTINHFTLIQPARVSFTGKEWRLEEKGILEFSQTNSSKELKSEDDTQEEFQQYQTELKELRSQLTQAKSEREQLQYRIDKIEAERKQLQVEFQENLNSLRKDYRAKVDGIEENLRSEINNLYNQLNNLDSSFEGLHKNNTPNPSPTLNTNNITQANIVEKYNENPANLSSDTEVLETTESIEIRRLGVSQRPVLEKVRRNQGNYWVINVEGIPYLVPKAKLRVTEHIFSTLNILFDCHNYRNDYTKFTLIKPAEVSKSGENWELKEKGILKFEGSEEETERFKPFFRYDF